MYTPEQLRIAFEDVAKGYGWPLDMGEVAYLSSETEKLWQGFRWGVNCAATLRQNPERGVTEAMVDRACEASWPVARWSAEASVEWSEAGALRRAHHRSVVEAALSAEPAAQGEAVAVIGADFTIHWIGTGPIAPIIEKHGLKVGDKLYTAPPAQPAERVPGAYVMDSGFKYESVGKHIPTVLVGFAPDDFDARDRFAAMLAATPAAPADGDGKEGESEDPPTCPICDQMKLSARCSACGYEDPATGAAR